jgi:hypothetical protein
LLLNIFKDKNLSECTDHEEAMAMVGWSVKLLLALASTVILGFKSHRDS